MMNYDKLTKKELIYTLIARDEMLKNCRERFELHKTTDANTIQDQSDLIDVLNKALELACEWLNDYQYFDSDCPRYSDCFNVENSKFWDCSNCDCSKLAIEHFKTKAKEMMKSA